MKDHLHIDLVSDANCITFLSRQILNIDQTKFNYKDVQIGREIERNYIHNLSQGALVHSQRFTSLVMATV